MSSTSPPALSSSAAAPARTWNLLIKLGPVLGLILVVALFSLLRPRTFCTVGNLQIMLLQTAVVGTAALGMTLIIISGGIDISVGSNIALATVVIATLLSHGYPPLAAAAGGVLVSACCGLLIGLLITQLRLPPFIATMALWGGLRVAAKGLAHETTVLAPSTWLNSLLKSVSPQQRWQLLPFGVWMLLILAILVILMLRYTRFGRRIFALGSNEQTARLCGVPVERTKIGIYMLATALVGLAGVLQFSYLTLGDPTTADGKELDIIAAVVIGGGSLSGGKGSIVGSLIGALVMTAVSNGCTKMELAIWVQQIVTASIIVLAVAIDQLRRGRGR